MTKLIHNPGFGEGWPEDIKPIEPIPVVDTMCSNCNRLMEGTERTKYTVRWKCPECGNILLEISPAPPES
jgi:ribosomal protein L37AE/L43A